MCSSPLPLQEWEQRGEASWVGMETCQCGAVVVQAERRVEGA